MALILAVNPGNSHSPTLSRLARELKGCELIGAESCAVAITAMKDRAPDVVLLPAQTPRGEADLLAHLKSVGGVLTLKLPPVESADPVELASQIREMLTGTPAAAPSDITTFGAPSADLALPATSPHLLAAATAAINWVRTRRAQWADATARDFAPEPLTQAAGATYEPHEPHERYEPIEPYEPIELTEEPHEAEEAAGPAGPSMLSTAAAAAAGIGGSLVAWLPRVGALAVVVGIAAAGVSYWPQIRGSVTGMFAGFNRPADRSPSVDANAKPVPPERGAAPAAEPDPFANISGWVAVFAPFEVSISEGNVGIQVDDRGRAMLAPGRHRLRFQNRALGYDETRNVDVKPTATTTINLLPQTTISVASSEPAEVLIDGTRAGDTPYDGKIGLGIHTVTVRTAEAERQLTVEATTTPVQLEVDFSKP